MNLLRTRAGAHGPPARCLGLWLRSRLGSPTSNILSATSVRFFGWTPFDTALPVRRARVDFQGRGEADSRGCFGGVPFSVKAGGISSIANRNVRSIPAWVFWLVHGWGCGRGPNLSVLLRLFAGSLAARAQPAYQRIRRSLRESYGLTADPSRASVSTLSPAGSHMLGETPSQPCLLATLAFVLVLPKSVLTTST